MKKFVKVIGAMCMAAVVACTASSCKKAEQEGSEFEVGLSQLDGFNSDERAYIDVFAGSQLKWNEGDQIMVYNLATDYTQSVAHVFTANTGAEGQTRIPFSGSPVGAKKDIGYFYFYPAAKASGSLLEDNRETFTVSSTQTYNPRTFIDNNSLVMACTVNAIPDNFTMQHIFGILNIKVTKATAARVKNIVVTDNVFNLAGTMSLKLPEVNSTTLSTLMSQCVNNDPGYAQALSNYLQDLGYESNGSSHSITLDCSKCDNNQGVLVNSTKKYFFVSLRPGALYRGFTVTINYMDENLEPTILNYDASNSYCIQPARFTNLTVGI